MVLTSSPSSFSIALCLSQLHPSLPLPLSLSLSLSIPRSLILSFHGYHSSISPSPALLLLLLLVLPCCHSNVGFYTFHSLSRHLAPHSPSRTSFVLHDFPSLCHLHSLCSLSFSVYHPNRPSARSLTLSSLRMLCPLLSNIVPILAPGSSLSRLSLLLPSLSLLTLCRPPFSTPHSLSPSFSACR